VASRSSPSIDTTLSFQEEIFANGLDNRHAESSSAREQRHCIRSNDATGSQYRVWRCQCVKGLFFPAGLNGPIK
jgi:hypothetical protein